MRYSPRLPAWLLLTALLLLLPGRSTLAVPLLNTNFDAAAVGNYADNAPITAGLVGRVGANTAVSVGDIGGNRSLTMTDNSGSFVGNGYPLVKFPYSGQVSSGPTGNNQLSGQFDVVLLQSGAVLNYMIQSGLNENSISTAQVVYLQVGSGGTLSYFNGSTSYSSGFSLTIGVNYRIKWWADLSSTTQDKWGFNIAAVSSPNTLIASFSNLNTRSPNLTPDIVVFRCGGNAGWANANPAYRLDNFALTATPSAPAPNTTLWRIGYNDNSFDEFPTSGSPSATYAVPTDWATRTDWSAWKAIFHGSHNAIDVTFNLASVPSHGVEFSFRSMWGHIAVPQLAVHANGNPAGIIQIWGERGTPAQSEIQFRKIYRLYIPSEFLTTGSNTLRLDIAPHTYETDVNPPTSFRWDYLQLDALSAPATEPIHGSLIYMGTHTLQKDVNTSAFTMDSNTVAHAETLLKWMGIAYSGNVLRAGFWSDVTSVQPARLAVLQKFRDLNFRVVANHLNLNHAQHRLVGTELAQQDKDLVNNFVASYSNLFQFFEVANEPGLIGPINLQTVLVHANYLNTVLPPHVAVTTPGWAYNTWEGVTANRRQVEDLCTVLGGHAYGASFQNYTGGSFTENIRSQGPILTDGFPKPFMATEMGTNNWHADYTGTPSQTNASIFDRITRAHIATATYFLQHASHYKHDNNFEDFSMFAPINWSSSSPSQQTACPGVGGQETRLQTWRRLALAYSTHGNPLPYTYLTKPVNQRVYFRAVNTATLDPLPASGATSNKVLLNFVNFEGVSRTLHLRVTMPSAGTWAGDRIGQGNVYSSAATTVSLNATPTLDFNIILPARESVQYILAPQ